MNYEPVKEVIRMLQREGFEFVRQTGSHMIFTEGKRVVIVPDHGSKGIEKGTYYNILRQAGLK